MADQDLQISGWGRGGGGRGWASHPDPEIRGVGGGLKKHFFPPFGPQFGLKIKGEGALGPHCPSPGSATV